MNELYVVFSQRTRDNKNCIYRYLTTQQEMNSNVNVWDETIINAIQKYGSIVVFGQQNMKYYKVLYPKELNVEIVTRFLDCFVFEHLWGEERCRFKLDLFVFDMIDNRTPAEECKSKLDLARQIRSECLNDIPMLTEDGKKMIEDYHKHCHKYYEGCMCEGKSTEDIYEQTEASVKMHSQACVAVYFCKCDEFLQTKI